MQTTRKIKEMEEIGKDVDKVIKDLEISLEEMNKIEKENEKIKHRICKVRTRPAPSISKIKELDISAQLGEIDELMKQIALNEIPFMLEEEDLRLLEMKEKEKLKVIPTIKVMNVFSDKCLD